MILNSTQTQKVSEKRITSLINIQGYLSDLPSVSTRLIAFNDEMPNEVKNILFFSNPAKNFLLWSSFFK